MTRQWEVVDGYNKIHFTGSLKECGLWVDPIFGIELPPEPRYSTRVDRNLSEADRFWAKVTKGATCWEHSGAPNVKGYVSVRVNKKLWLAHRYAWTITFGPIPDGLCVLHSCDNPPCCRPDHLFLGTKATNNADMMVKGRHGWKTRTHCVNGHEWTSENTRIGKRGTRECRACDRERGSHSNRRRSDFEGEEWPTYNGESIDHDRFELQPDGSYTIQMYEGPGGVGGELYIRPKED